ncbi:MAG: dehypoxanthine futalosine cyclase [Magnetococcales bacterium]|nr:dehypoxanthine futalosine cyclase [Magnetococcales bacterium]
MNSVDYFQDKLKTKQPFNTKELLDLFDMPLPLLGYLADQKRRQLHPQGVVTYHIDRNINYSNLCVTHCDFCAFYRGKNDKDSYVESTQSLHQKIDETLAAGGDQILLQGGHHPDWLLNDYLTLLQTIKDYRPIHIHAFSPPEIVHIAKLSGVSTLEVLRQMKKSGLSSMPGGGAEILVDEIRQKVSPKKCSADEWLAVMQEVADLGMQASATMMFGHVETREHRIEHLLKIEALQKSTNVFVAFIPWTFSPGNTKLAQLKPVGSVEYLRTLAVSRLALNSFNNIQASWLSQGAKVAQVALNYGANDMGSVMLEENVLRSAKTHNQSTEPQLIEWINLAGFSAKKRNFYYKVVD